MKIFIEFQPKVKQTVKQRMRTQTRDNHVFALKIEDWGYSKPPIAKVTVVKSDDGMALDCRRNVELILPFFVNTTVAKKKNNDNPIYKLQCVKAKVQSRGNNSYSAYFDGLVLSFCSNKRQCSLQFEVFANEQRVYTVLSEHFVVGSKKQNDSVPSWEIPILEYKKIDKRMEVEMFPPQRTYRSRIQAVKKKRTQQNDYSSILQDTSSQIQCQNVPFGVQDNLYVEQCQYLMTRFMQQSQQQIDNMSRHEAWLESAFNHIVELLNTGASDDLELESNDKN
jgi:hypothetical protein